jgi:hypothetical protein
MKKKFLFFVSLFFTQIIFSQDRADIWYFGEHVGIDFSNGAPSILLNSSMDGFEASASITDCAGNLLFYTNGINVWDSTHNITPNGNGLLGHISTSQILIIPQTATNYFIIYSDNEGGANGLRYSEFDASLNGGLGDIKSATKNTLLHNNASERMAATYNADKTGIWLLTMNISSTSFHNYLITNTGISTPEITPINHSIYATCCETMKFSPNGNWLAYTNSNSSSGEDSKLYTFNNLTGEIILHSTLPRNTSTNESQYGISFSPNSSKLYISTIYNIQTGGAFNRLYQYNLENTGVPQSQFTVFTETFSGSGAVNSPFGSLQIAPDGKIYLARWNEAFLGVINNPNLLGQNCNFILNGLSLNGQDSRLGLPNYIDNYFNEFDTYDFCQPLNIKDFDEGYFEIYPNPVSDYLSINLNKAFENLNIEILNTLGQEIMEFNYSNTTKLKLNLNNLPNGLYFLKLNANGGSIIERIIKK